MPISNYALDEFVSQELSALNAPAAKSVETLTPGSARARLAVLAALALCSNQYSVAPRRELH
jgi:hypothetical protein